MNRAALQKKYEYWRYLGYDRETLARYETQIAADNRPKANSKESRGCIAPALFAVMQNDISRLFAVSSASLGPALGALCGLYAGRR